jgi:hypothetical protein
MEAFVPYVGLAGSVFSTVLTVYFWLVKSRRERPDLRGFLADRELFLGTQTADRRQIGVKLGLVVANYSSLPNAILGVSMSAKQRDGTWLALEDVTFDKQTPMPFNVPSLQTVLLRVTGRANLASVGTLEQGGNLLGNYITHYLTNPREFRVELQALNDRRFTATLTFPAATG